MPRVFVMCAALALATATIPGWARGQDSAATAVSDKPPAPAEEAPEVDETVPVAVPEASEKAMAFYTSGLWLWAFSRLWVIALPAIILFTGASARIRDAASANGRRGWGATVVVYLALYMLITAVIELPLDYYRGFLRLHAYGLSNQTPVKWGRDHLLEFGVGLALSVPVALGAYAFLRFAPRRWWLLTALASIPALFAIVYAKPLWIDPLFNKFGPMQDKVLERSILDLASRAGIEGSRVFEVDKSVDTKAVNAYVTGFQGSKRIVLWDTLLARLNRREVLFVMAHEMGHYVLGHVVRSILLSFTVTLAGLYFVHRASAGLIRRFGPRFGFDSLSDPASMPLILMLVQIAFLFLSPAAMSYSRYQEQAADRFALELTGMKHSGASAFVKLQEENLGNPRPGWIYRLFLASHPSIGERIDACNAYQPAPTSRSK